MRSLLLALVLLGAEPKLKPDDWNIWAAAGQIKVEEFNFQDANGKAGHARGYCQYTLFVYGKTDTLYYWTLAAARMNDEAISGGDSFDVRVPFGHTGEFDIRIFLTLQDSYGKPFTKQLITLTCDNPLKDNEWIMKQPEVKE